MNATDPFKAEDYDLADDMFRQAIIDNLDEEDNVAAIRKRSTPTPHVRSRTASSSSQWSA